MEIVKKIISLEPLRSRQFSLIPYLGMKKVDGQYVLSQNGNWGYFPFDIDISKCKGYETLKNYFCNSNRVSFFQIINKWRLFENIFNKSFFQKRVLYMVY